MAGRAGSTVFTRKGHHTSFVERLGRGPTSVELPCRLPRGSGVREWQNTSEPPINRSPWFCKGRDCMQQGWKFGSTAILQDAGEDVHEDWE